MFQKDSASTIPSSHHDLVRRLETCTAYHCVSHDRILTWNHLLCYDFGHLLRDLEIKSVGRGTVAVSFNDWVLRAD